MHSLPVLLRQEAIADLDEIASYLIAQGAHQTVVLGFIQRIRTQCETIGRAPEGYAARPDLGAGIRIAPFERRAVIVFRVEKTAVEIVNIFYGGRDYSVLFGN